MPGKLLENSCENIIDKQCQIDFDPTESLFYWIKKLDLNFVLAGSRDINDSKVINILARCDVNVCLFRIWRSYIAKKDTINWENVSSFTGDIYQNKSTTNYYSILRSGSIGASAILLTKEID